MSKWQGFYSTDQVSRLAGIPVRILYRWRKQNVVPPSVRVIDFSGKVEEGYSYRDLAVIKVLWALKLRKLNLRSAVIAFQHLYDRFGPPTSKGWQDAHVYIDGKNVFAQKPDNWDTTLATKGGQKGEMRVLGELTEEEGALLVPRRFSEYVEINPEVMDGEPVVRDTRVPTFMLATLAAERLSPEEIARIYDISKEAVVHGIAFEKDIEEIYSSVKAKVRTKTISEAGTPTR